jgi:hypothetical protein
MFILSYHARFVFVLGCLVVAAMQGRGAAFAREPSKEVVGLAIVRISDLPRSWKKTAKGKDVLAVDVQPDPDGSWTGEFTVVHWFRKPLNPARKMPDSEEEPSMRSVKVNLPARETFEPLGLQLAHLKDKNFVMEIRLVDNKLVSEEFWPLPELPALANK